MSAAVKKIPFCTSIVELLAVYVNLFLNNKDPLCEKRIGQQV